LIARAYLVVFSDTTPAMGENGEPEFNLNDPRSMVGLSNMFRKRRPRHDHRHVDSDAPQDPDGLFRMDAN
jgi:hypothetical protein